MSDPAPAPPATLVARLRAAGCVFAEEEAELLVEAAQGPRHLAQLAARREGGEPLEQVLGWAGFCGLRVAVAPGVFVPRRRTELLVTEAVARAGRGRVVVDLCCGTGAVGLAVAVAVGGARLYAADLDPAAVACARRNLAPLGAWVGEGDLFDALPWSLHGQVDVLVVNAPYVPTDAVALMPREAREHEARLALDGGPDGVDVHRRVAAVAEGWLAPGGSLLVETSREQSAATEAAVAGGGLRTTVRHDEELDATVVVGTCP